MLIAAGSGVKLPSPLPPQLLDRYQVDRRIGRGGMAEVYHGRLVRMGGFTRDVAVKILLPQYSDEPEFVNMLMDEARIAGTIYHPNVVQMLDVGQDGETCYLVMEYVDGIDLRSVERRHAGGRVPLVPLLYIIADVLRGLSAIHTARDPQGQPLHVVHRDVTPSNVLLTLSGVAKLADFGIAHATGRLTQTRHGAVKGKTRYMAPEQLDGRAIDCRTDLFAVGVVLLEALCGRDAAEAWQHTAMGPIFRLPARLPKGLPDDVHRILHRTLGEAPDERYDSAAAFRREVLRALQERTRDAEVAYGADDLMAFLQQVRELPEAKLSSSGQARNAEEESGASLPSPPAAEPAPAPPGPAAPARPEPAAPIAAPELPLLAPDKDAPTEMAARPPQEPTVEEQQEFSTLPIDQRPAPQPAYLPTMPMPAVRVSGAEPAERTLSMHAAQEGGGGALDTLADESTMDAQGATAVTEPWGVSPLSQTVTRPHRSPLLRDEGHTGMTRAREPGLRGMALQARRSGPGQLMRSTVIRTQETLGKLARSSLQRRLFLTVLLGMALAGIGLFIVYRVQAGRTHPQAPVALEALPEPPPSIPVKSPPPPPRKGQLQLSAAPNVRVFIDGVRQRDGQRSYELSPGTHTLRLVVSRHREMTRAIEIQPGAELKLSYP